MSGILVLFLKEILWEVTVKQKMLTEHSRVAFDSCLAKSFKTARRARLLNKTLAR